MKMESLNAISRWLIKKHVLSYCVGSGDSLWCANAFYIFNAERVAFYLLSETTSRHGEMIGEQAPVAGTINSQPKTVALIRGVQFRGKIHLLSAEEAANYRSRYLKRFPIAKVMSAPVWKIRLDELKMTDNTLGFRKKLHWLRE